MFNTSQFIKYNHKDLVLAGYNWLMRRANCGVAFREFKTLSAEIPDVIGFQSSGISFLIEVKVSRSDFLSDKKKSFRKYPTHGMGRYRYYLCPANLIHVPDLPDGWGLLWIDGKGRVKCMYNPYDRFITVAPSIPDRSQRHPGFLQNMVAEHGLMYSALRRIYLRNLIETIYDQSYFEGGYAEEKPEIQDEQTKLF